MQMHVFSSVAHPYRMWKLLVVIGMIFSLCTMAGCEVEEMGSLESLSKPYTGVYECEKMLLSGEDVLDDFAYLRLELEYGGNFTLSYKKKDGSVSEWNGTYEMDTEENEITMSAMQGAKTLSRTYRVERGAILIDENFLGRTLFAEFKM